MNEFIIAMHKAKRSVKEIAVYLLARYRVLMSEEEIKEVIENEIRSR